MPGRGIALDARLSAIAQMVGRCGSYADIGCDHGRLGAFLLQKGWVKTAFLNDISEISLEKARRLCRLIGVEDRARFFAGDGLAGLPEAVDKVVIAGMGGETIEGILERGASKLQGAELVLQANVGKPSLRTYLTRHGYRIADERIVTERGRCYVIISAVPGTQALTREEAVIGPVLLKEKPKALLDYKAFRLRVAEKALRGAEQGGRPEEREPLLEEIAIWKGLIIDADK